MNNIRIQQALDQSGIARLDAQLILSHVLSKPKSYLIAWPDNTLSEAQCNAFNHYIEQRAAGYPVAYIIGKKSFWDMELTVTPDVLIPRPETELLVELALTHIPLNGHVLELATGSGAIACALARERKDIHITATDICVKALSIAQQNALSYQLNSITFIESNWFADISPQPFDVILANPPYLASADPHLSADIRFEPKNALVSGEMGDEALKTIISQAKAFLKKNGWLLLEHGAEQGSCRRELFMSHGYQNIFTANDLAGLERVSGGKLK